MWCAISSICCMDALLVIPQSLVAGVRIFKSPRQSSVKTRRCLLTSHRWVIKNSSLRYGHPAFVLHGVKGPVSATGALYASRPSLRSTLSIFDGGFIVVVPFSAMPTCTIVTAMCVSLWFRVVDAHEMQRLLYRPSHIFWWKWIKTCMHMYRFQIFSIVEYII